MTGISQAEARTLASTLASKKASSPANKLFPYDPHVAVIEASPILRPLSADTTTYGRLAPPNAPHYLFSNLQDYF